MKLKPRFLGEVCDLVNHGLAFDWTICQVCNRHVCYRKSTLKVMHHHLPTEGVDRKYGWPIPKTKSTRCEGSGQKRVMKLLRSVTLYDCDAS